MAIHPDDDIGALERARRRLYSGDELGVEQHVRLSAEEHENVPHGWAAMIAPKAHPHVRGALIFFVGAFLFFVVAGGAATYLLLSGTTAVSTNNITLAVQGPTSVASGDTVPLSLAITNKNSVALENASVEIDFPDGTRSATDQTQAYPRYTEDLGSIPPGATVLRSVKAVIFGGSATSLTLPISLSYSSAGSNSTFIKRQTYPLAISSAPLSVSVVAPAEAVPNQPFTITVEVRSNATAPISDVTLGGVFPRAFTLTTASMQVTGGNIAIGTLAAGQTKSITYTGALAGSTNDLQNFKFTVGTGANPDGSPALPYMTQGADVTIAAPFIATSFSVNGGDANSAVITPGSVTSVRLDYQNTLDTAISNAEIDIAISGGAVDYGSIQAPSGFYRSSDHTLVFSQSTDPALAELAPGASGTETFTFSVPAAVSAKGPTVTLTASVSGARMGQTNVPQSASAVSSATLKIGSAVAFAATPLHSSGPFTNTGPVPPVVNSPTSYTVVWKVTNPNNAITNLNVTAMLPPYVAYAGKATGDVAFDPATRTVTWKPADLSAGQVATVAFVVTLTPSLSQGGTAPALTSAPTFTAFDRFTQAAISLTAPAPTTETTADPGYNSNMASVH